MSYHDWRIRTKVLAILISAMLASTITVGVILFYNFKAMHEDYQSLLEDKAFALSENIRQIMNQNLEMFALDRMVWMSTYLLGVVDSNADISYAFIADSQPTVLYHSDEQHIGTQLHAAVHAHIEYDLLFTRLMIPIQQHYEIIVPIVKADQVIGTIHLGIPQELIDSRLFNRMAISIGTLVLAWGAALWLIYSLLKRQIIQPLSELASKATYVSRHRDLTQRMIVHHDDEIGRLSSAFNTMIASLLHYYQDLEAKVRKRTIALQNRNEQLNREIQQRQQLEISLRIAKDQAEAASQAKSEFLARMSHEIRTPMNAVLGMTELLSETSLNHHQRDYLHTLSSSGELLLSIINDILDFSKIEAGQLELETMAFDLVGVVENIAQTVAPRAHQKGLELAFHIAPEVYPYRLGDPTRLRQILMNLLGNAVKFTAQGEIIIEVTAVDYPESETEADESLLRFSVRDTGIGIAPQHHASIFESFSQADASTTRQYGGSGLGLAICKQLVELMGGHINVYSQVDQGSEFVFTLALPLATSIPESWMAPESETRQALQQQRLLVVDDTAANRLLLHDYLTSWGGEVDTVDTGQQALDALARAQQQQRPYTLVLMDIHMPEMNGFDTIHAWHQHHATPLPIFVVLTSGEAFGDRERLQALGVHAYLTKPVRRSVLLDTLLMALGKKQDAPQPATLRNDGPVLPQARLLLAEDIAANRQVIKKFLQDSPITCIEAVNGQEAVDLATTESFDLILMDVEMPEMDGLEAIRRIRAWEHRNAQPPVPIITLTAHAFSEHREQSQAAGSTAFIAKPVRKTTLLRLLSEWLPAMPANTHDLAATEPPPAQEPQAAAAKPVQISEFMQDLLPEFFTELAAAQAQMQQAILDNDGIELRRLAHGYKGAAGSYELDALAQLLRTVEQAALTGDMAAAQTHLTEVDTYLRQLVIEC